MEISINENTIYFIKENNELMEKVFQWLWKLKNMESKKVGKILNERCFYMIIIYSYTY